MHTHLHTYIKVTDLDANNQVSFEAEKYPNFKRIQNKF